MEQWWKELWYKFIECTSIVGPYPGIEISSQIQLTQNICKPKWWNGMIIWKICSFKEESNFTSYILV